MTSLESSWWTRVLAGPDGDLEAARSDEHYVVLPRESDPRVVVDRANPIAVRDAVERFAANRTRVGMLKSLAGGGSSLLVRTRATWRVATPEPGRTLRQHLSEVLGTDVRLSVSVGPPRPNRKPVIRCYDHDGLIAVAKLGPDTHTAAMVRNESRWLDAMAGRPLTGVSTPPLIHAGEYEGIALLVMGALDLESDLGVEFSEVPIGTADEFARRHADQISLASTNWWHELRRRIDAPALRSIAVQVFQAQEHPNFEQIAVSGWHGDWSPWNMGRSRGGRFCIWDWERATIGVPTGFDIAHLHHHYGAGLDAADSDLERLGVPPEHHRLLKRLYLFELCARHADADALDTDGHVNVLAALDRLSPTAYRS